jgi:3-mercaptopyruvate sulfurtransferase SseA
MSRLACLLFVFFTAAASAQVEGTVSAQAAAQALARGATVVDIRAQADYQQGHLPGAVRLDAQAALDSVAALQDLVSRQGVNLSRDVVVVGEPGDLLAQRLQQHMARFASGRVTWLVGGVHEWALSGRPLETTVVQRRAVPQYLVALQPEPLKPRMAAAALRDPSALF